MDGTIIQKSDYGETSSSEVFPMAYSSTIEGTGVWEDLAARLPLGVFRLSVGDDGEIAMDYANPRLVDMMGGSTDPVQAFLGGLESQARVRFDAEISSALGAREEYSWRGSVLVSGEARFFRLSLWPENSTAARLFAGMVEDLTLERRSAELRRLALFKLGELTAVLNGGDDDEAGGMPGGQVSWTSLSAREREVAVCVLEGFSNNEVSARLGISLSTAKKHVNALFRKLGVRTRAELFALERGSK